VSSSKPDGSSMLERSLLRDQAKRWLRDEIVSGRIAPGTKLVEQALANRLGTSRIPVRDALIELEKEGLVANRGNGHYVIELTEQDVRELNQVRLSLELLAVELATQNTSPSTRAILTAQLEQMRAAMSRNDRPAIVESDVGLHTLIWQQAGNRHLLSVLKGMVGPIVMFAARHAEYYDLAETFRLHEDLVACINSGKVSAARDSLQRHTDNSLQRSLQVFPVRR
jgi:DNA-binding GntR family transcriptional regulator